MLARWEYVTPSLVSFRKCSIDEEKHMTNTNEVSTRPEVKRVGILLGDLGKLNTSALKFLVLRMNTLQHTFEYEFLPVDPEDEFLQKLSNQACPDREEVRRAVCPFYDRYRKYLDDEITRNKLRELPTNSFVLLTMARFSNNYLSLRENGLSVLALGNWNRWMAPPSILEFILTLIMRESVAFVSPSLRGSFHLGTKGCLFDFALFLGDVRFKVLNGFVCSYCRATLQSDGFSGLADELVLVLGKQWLGKSTDPDAPAGITANLGYDLFITKGLKATPWENFLITMQQEGVKQLLTIVGAVVAAILIAVLLVLLGLKR
jgi:hypothetical protein